MAYKVSTLRSYQIGCSFAYARSRFGTAVRTKVPISGEKNTMFGVFASHCCGNEIVIRSGAVFPTCPEHPRIRTFWIAIEVGPDNVTEIPKNESKKKPAA
jgi:hypothetical protein